jgi:uncharacterized protein (DUF433 family)
VHVRVPGYGIGPRRATGEDWSTPKAGIGLRVFVALYEVNACGCRPRTPLGQPEAAMGPLDRIASDPAIFGGKPIVRGMRISVELVLSLLAQGESQETIMVDYPGLQPEDIRACLAYAHAVVANDRLDDVVVSHS